MTRPPPHRACMALRLPRGLYCYNARADVPLSDAEIRANLRRQHVATERLVLALADLFNYDLSGGALWPLAKGIAIRHDLPASMIGALALAAMLPEEGDADPDEWALVVEAAP